MEKIRITIRKEFAEQEIAVVEINEDKSNETGIKIKDLACFDRDAEIILTTIDEA